MPLLVRRLRELYNFFCETEFFYFLCSQIWFLKICGFICLLLYEALPYPKITKSFSFHAFIALFFLFSFEIKIEFV